ncbi:DMP19 family protein [Gymnodinialimonas hymeniacidonis]|uniref:DMP19 family protein n=1 Tax=Gymnodinialimonas hymeniacidonis TaxID=3126508 RepID=UPI0034C5FA66
MRIGEAFIERLLASSDAADAVATLSGFWAHRARDGAMRMGLAEPEWQVQLILIYTGEVWNGGHAQYHMNRGTELADPTCSALTAVGLRGHAAVLRDVTGGAWSPAELARADRAFDDLEADVDAALLAHLRRHADTILLPERRQSTG